MKVRESMIYKSFRFVVGAEFVRSPSSKFFSLKRSDAA